MTLNLLFWGQGGGYLACAVTKASLIVMFMHVNVNQNTMWVLLCVKQAACIMGKPRRLACVFVWMSWELRLCIRVTRWAWSIRRSLCSPTSRESCTRWKAVEKSLSCKYLSSVTMFRCEDKVDYTIIWKTECECFVQHLKINHFNWLSQELCHYTERLRYHSTPIWSSTPHLFFFFV